MAAYHVYCVCETACCARHFSFILVEDDTRFMRVCLKLKMCTSERKSGNSFDIMLCCSVNSVHLVQGWVIINQYGQSLREWEGMARMRAFLHSFTRVFAKGSQKTYNQRHLRWSLWFPFTNYVFAWQSNAIYVTVTSAIVAVVFEALGDWHSHRYRKIEVQSSYELNPIQAMYEMQRPLVLSD